MMFEYVGEIVEVGKDVGMCKLNGGSEVEVLICVVSKEE